MRPVRRQGSKGRKDRNDMELLQYSVAYEKNLSHSEYIYTMN